jgi:hypothetical protein
MPGCSQHSKKPRFTKKLSWTWSPKPRSFRYRL